MAGGKGTRFWPESTRQNPKQYLSIVGEKSLLETSLARFEGLIPADQRFIITVKEQEQLAKENSKGLVGKDGIIFEPCGRNTAPCILLSIANLMANGASKEDVVTIVPSDHVILNEKGFRKSIEKAANIAAENKKIVTIGIPTSSPHTGYGYIQKGKDQGDRSYDVLSFKEKPNFEVAKEYVASGNYYWNAGMFVAPLGTFLEEFEKHSPEIYKFYSQLYDHFNDFKKISEIYQQIPKDSIDYAVMEKTDKIMVLEAGFDWNDLGSWDALEQFFDKKDGNCWASKNEIRFVENAKNNIVHVPNKIVALIGIEDMIIVESEDALVIVPKDQSQKIKDIVNFVPEKFQ